MAVTKRTNNEAATLAPITRESLGHTKRAITGALYGVPQGAAFVRAMATADERGVTLGEARIRYAALGGPAWFEAFGASDLHWFASHPGQSMQGAGRTHEYRHVGSADATPRVSCIGHGTGDVCDATAPNMGADDAGKARTTWRYVGDVAAYDADDAEIATLAVERTRHLADVVAAMFGRTRADVARDVPYFAALLAGKVAGKASKPTK